MSHPSTVAALLTIHCTELVAFVEKRLGSRTLAEDIVQQAAVRAIDGAQGLRDPQAGRAWLFQITRRLVAEHFRQRSEAALSFDPESPPGLDRFGCACVLVNLRQLKPVFAEVLQRVDLDGVPVSQAAAELGLSANAATVRLSRARAALRDQLHTHCGTDSLRGCLDCPCDERGCCDPQPDATHRPD